jgi:hypothetical protein
LRRDPNTRIFVSVSSASILRKMNRLRTGKHTILVTREAADELRMLAAAGGASMMTRELKGSAVQRQILFSSY